MSQLPDKCFAKQSKLQHLQMDFNLISNITNATFSGLKSLTYLSLRGNQLTGLSNELGLLDQVVTKGSTSIKVAASNGNLTFFYSFVSWTWAKT